MLCAGSADGHNTAAIDLEAKEVYRGGAEGSGADQGGGEDGAGQSLSPGLGSTPRPGSAGDREAGTSSQVGAMLRGSKFEHSLDIGHPVVPSLSPPRLRLGRAPEFFFGEFQCNASAFP